MSAAPQLEQASERCFHCGDSLVGEDVVFEPIASQVRGFCCRGCLAAAELIAELGLLAFYERREPSVAPLPRPEPEALGAFTRFDDDELQRGFATFEPDGDRSAVLSVGGMRCAACSWLLEERLSRVPGVRLAQFGLANQRARVRWDPEAIALSEILARIAELGYRPTPFEPDAEEALIRSERRSMLRRLGVAGLGTMQVMMFAVALYAGSGADLESVHRSLLQYASWLVATPVLLYSGWPFLSGGWRDLRVPRVGPDVPIALALLGAYAASVWATVRGEGEVYFDSVCMFVFFITLGRALERDLRARAEMRIRGLQRRAPQVAHRIEAGSQRDVPVVQLREGDLLEVRPGETVPADGLVVDGRGGVSESLLTGEASAVAKQAGSTLLAGSQNLDGTLTLRVERVGAASTLQQIAGLLDRAQLEKSPVAVLANRLARVFLAAVLAAALAVGLVWWWLDASRVVPVVISVLIATCPCALSLATPAALAAATHGLAARGFLITRGHALEALARVTRVVFDKTGTLTESAPVLVGVRPLRRGVDESEALELALRLEEGSNHPIARALRVAAPPRASSRVRAASPKGVEPGSGVWGEVAGRLLRFGRPDWSASLSPGALEQARVEDPTGPSVATAPTALLADARGAIAQFEFETRLRPDAEGVVSWLGQSGYATSLLSGDPSQSGVAAVARQLHLADARGSASPEAKLRALDDWIERGDVVLAIGDGVNDAPLLGRAQVSLAMGSGSELARLGADAVLLDDRLEAIPMALCWAKRARRVMQQNFAWALAYNLCALPLAATGLLAPYAAAIGMSLSSLLVVGNSLRLRRPPSVRPAQLAKSATSAQSLHREAAR